MTGEIIKVYEYRDELGELLYQNCRYEPKDFRQRRPVGNSGWVWNLDGVRRVLYRLQELLRANPDDWVFIVEGEADCDRLVEHSLTATTAGAVNSWRDEFAEFLNDRKVCILPDNDKAGKDLAVRITKALRNVDCPEIKVLNLPGLAKAEDVSDWLNNGGTVKRLLELLDNTKPPEPDKHLRHQVLSEVEPKEVQYLQPEVIPLGMFTGIISLEGVGKSTLGSYIAARISKGRPWPNSPTVPNPKGHVIIFNHEESVDCVLVPRLIANDADLDRIIIEKGIIESDGSEQVFDIERNIPELDTLINEFPETRLIIFDPITSYCTCNENSNSEVRRALKLLIDFAARRNIAVLGLTHLNKKVDLGMINRTIGSRAWSAVPRMTWGIRTEQIEDDEGHKTETDVRFLLNIKCNIGPKPKGLKFRIGEDGKVIFDNERIDMTMDDSQTKKISDAVEWLQARLSSGAALSQTLFSEGSELGFNEKMLNRAKEKLPIKTSRTGYGKDGRWFWELRTEKSTKSNI